MGNCISIFRRNQILLLLLLFLWGYCPSYSQPGEKILFLKFRMKNNNISLVQAKVRPGHLKLTPGGPGMETIRYVVLSGSGDTQWVGTMQDPGIRRLEFEDTVHPGHMMKKFVNQSDTKFTLRVPLLPDAKEILFFRPNPGGMHGTSASPDKPFSRVPFPRMEGNR